MENQVYNMGVDPYDIKTKIDVQLKHLEADKRLSKTDKEDIINFYKEEGIDKNLSHHRQYKFILTLHRVALYLRKPFREATEEDLRELLRGIKEGKFTMSGKAPTTWTFNSYCIIIKHFYRWLEKLPKGQSSKRAEWISTTLSKREVMNEARHKDIVKNFLDHEEFEAVRREIKSPMYRFLIELLAESGCRISEILTLTWDNVQFNGRELTIVVTGKTGTREVPSLITCLPYYKEWNRFYPLPKTPGNKVFITKFKGHYSPVMYKTFQKWFKAVMARTGIQKRIHAHLFRKIAATRLASMGMNESMLNKYFGWANGSAMSGFYVMLASNDLRKALHKLRGDEVEDSKKEINCPMCSQSNPAEAKVCCRCGVMLDKETALRVSEFRRIEERYSSLPALEQAKTIEDLKRLIYAEMQKDFYAGKLTFKQ